MSRSSSSFTTTAIRSMLQSLPQIASLLSHSVSKFLSRLSNVGEKDRVSRLRDEVAAEEKGRRAFCFRCFFHDRSSVERGTSKRRLTKRSGAWCQPIVPFSQRLAESSSAGEDQPLVPAFLLHVFPAQPAGKTTEVTALKRSGSFVLIVGDFGTGSRVSREECSRVQENKHRRGDREMGSA